MVGILRSRSRDITYLTVASSASSCTKNSTDMRTIFKALRGSHAHGLATPESDRDFFSIVIPPVEAIIGLGEMKGSQRIEGDEDIRIITLKEFLRAVEHGRSTELEMLWAPEDCILECDDTGQTLLNNKEKLLSERLFKPLFGFAGGQIQRSIKGNNDRFDPKLGYDPKSMTHAFRSLWQAGQLKESPQLPLRLPDHMQCFLRQVKAGDWSKDEILECIDEWDRDMRELSAEWDIPAGPNRVWMEDFLMCTYAAEVKRANVFKRAVDNAKL